jgi:hypothetical protein
MRNTDFIGTGWSFPPTFNKQTKAVELVSGKEDIEGSLHILLSTTIGERVMQPLYGCNLKQFLFEPTNTALTAHIKKLVEDAILYFEPRIKLEQLNVDADDGRMEITVEYTIKINNSRSNFVYPFYLKEGTDL